MHDTPAINAAATSYLLGVLTFTVNNGWKKRAHAVFPTRVRVGFAQGEAVWEKPAELSKKAETVAGVPQFERPEEWVCYLDENSGEEYWFNVTTGETHWGAN